MIDFDKISQEQLIARGQYSMVRRAKEDALNTLRALCEDQKSASAAVLRDIQEKYDVTHHFTFMRSNIEEMAALVSEIDSLSRQLELLAPLAFAE